MSIILPDQAAKLPKWVQMAIQDLQREHDTAVYLLNQFHDEQKESNVSYSEYACTGEQSGPTKKTRYLQTDRVHFQLGKEEDAIEARIDGGKLRLSTNFGRIHIACHCSNVVEIYCNRL